MPSRPLTFGIILFWLATMGWMFYREIWPRFIAGEPPPFHIEVADEVGGRVILWEVFEGEERIGSATTKINRGLDGAFELRNDVNFLKMNLGLLQLKKISDKTRIGLDGELLSLSALMRLQWGGVPVDIEFSGVVQDRLLIPKLAIPGVTIPEGMVTPVELPKQGGVLNILNPQNKITGLFVGRRWKVPVFDPFAASLSAVSKSYKMQNRFAEVFADELTLLGKPVPCWRIDVKEPNEPPLAKIWVRKSDDLVVQNSAQHLDKELVMKRVLTK